MKDEEVHMGYYNWRTPTHIIHIKLIVRTDDWPQLLNTLMNMSCGLHASMTLKIMVVLLINLTVPLQITTEPSFSFENISHGYSCSYKGTPPQTFGV